MIELIAILLFLYLGYLIGRHEDCDKEEFDTSELYMRGKPRAKKAKQ